MIAYKIPMGKNAIVITFKTNYKYIQKNY